MHEWFLSAVVFLLKHSISIALITVVIALCFNYVITSRLQGDIEDLKFDYMKLRAQVNTFHDKGAPVRIRRSPTIDIKPRPTFSLEDIEVIE